MLTKHCLQYSKLLFLRALSNSRDDTFNIQYNPHLSRWSADRDNDSPTIAAEMDRDDTIWSRPVRRCCCDIDQDLRAQRAIVSVYSFPCDPKLTINRYGFEFFIWYVREATVALLVCNLPFVWSLVSEFFPALKAWAGKNDLESMPRFWRERKGTCHLFRQIGRRKRSTTYGMPSFIEMNDTNYFDAKQLAIVQTECVADLDPVARKLSTKYESAVVGRIVSGELDDEIQMVDKVAERKVFGGSEGGLAVPLSSFDLPSLRGALRVDSVAEGMDAIRADQGNDDGKHCSCCSNHLYDDKHES